MKEDSSSIEDLKKQYKELKKKGIKLDSYAEAYVRNLAIANAMDDAFNIYDIFKKSMDMPSFQYGGTTGDTMRKPPQSAVDKLFGFK